MKYALPLFTAILLIWTAYQQRQLAALQGALEAQNNLAATESHKAEEAHYELAEVMGRMHLYMNKLWFSGKAENWELANFYAHELEESLEELYGANVVDEGIEISKLAKVMAEKPFSDLELSVKQAQLSGFETAYQRMVITCNQCHQSAKHGFIRLQMPQSPVFDSQIYSKP